MPYSYFDQAEITSYKDAVTWFAKCRSPEKGRPLKKWARVFKTGDTFEFKFGDRTFATLTPDNILTFPCTVGEMRRMSITFSQASYRALPVLFMRLATGRYAIEHSLSVDNRSQGNRYGNMREHSPEYFQSIQFDMNTGACINQRPRLTESVNTEARKTWLNKLRKFKRGIKVRAKMGVIEGICQQVAVERSKNLTTWSQPDWSSDAWSNMLYTAMNEEQFPTELLCGFVMSSRVSYWRQENPTSVSMLDAMDSVLQQLSVELRRKFGVFDQGECDE